MSMKQGFSLVKYDTPILVSKSFGKGSKKGNQGIASTDTSASSAQSLGDVSSQRTEDYLNSILPPKEFTDAG